MNNYTRRDARIRVMRAKMGCTKNATTEYLLELRKQLLRFVYSIDRNIFCRSSYIEVDDDDIVTEVYTIKKEK
jgi:hypothetical protein